MNNKEKNNLLEDFLKQLYEDNDLKDTTSYIDNLKKIYDGDFRHEYSRITQFLVRIDDSEAADMLIGKIDSLNREIDEISIKKNIEKLIDHITLENIRLSKLRDLSDANVKYKDLLESYNKLEEKIKNTSKMEEKISEKIENNNNQSITILGIFAGIVMAFTGGLSFIASSMQHINAISKYRLIFIIILLSMVMFNTIFMLIYTIGKLTNRYVGSKCGHSSECSNCNEKRIKCILFKYPLMALMNTSSMLLLFITFLIYLVDKFEWIKHFLDLDIEIRVLFIVVAFMIIIMLVLSGWLIHVVRKLKKLNSKDNKGVAVNTSGSEPIQA